MEELARGQQRSDGEFGSIGLRDMRDAAEGDHMCTSPSGTFLYDVLVDIMVHYVKSRIVVDEYCMAFRRAILLRYVNLRNQERFRMERSRLIVTKSDLEEMQDRLGRSDTYAAAERGNDEDVKEQLARRGIYVNSKAHRRQIENAETVNTQQLAPRGSATVAW